MDEAKARLALADALQLHRERVHESEDRVATLRALLDSAERALAARRRAREDFIRAMGDGDE